MTASLDVQGMRERHQRRSQRWCDADGQTWPCEVIRALDALERAERVVEAARAVDNFGDLSDAAELASWEGLQASLATYDVEVGR